MNKMINVYFLFNPVTQMPFYVGATINDLRTRLTGHLNCTMNKKKAALIKEIKDSGNKPTIHLLKRINVNKAQTIEKKYYNKFVESGYYMVNDTRQLKYTINNLNKGKK